MPELHDQQAERAYKAADKKSLQQNQRTLRIADGRGTFTGDEWLSLCEDHGNRCVLCSYARPLTPDHVVPLMSGGSNFIRNLQPLCHPCNIIERGTAVDYKAHDALQCDNLDGPTPIENITERASRPIWRGSCLRSSRL
jgi:5-methylcytosine-specific restriction endonuclease McrA